MSTPAPAPSSTVAPVPAPITSAPAATSTAAPVAPPAAPAPTTLPLSYATGNATQVITVVAPSRSSTTGTLQLWTKTATGWSAYGPAVPAHLGADGISTTPSETTSKTPMGSFTLTQAFGHDANPGAKLPYLQTTAADWWISQPGALYNTEQHCTSGCAFTQGDPNEHLASELPYYNYAVVIDYNTANAGPVVQGAGSAFFLHVTDGKPTAGCVAIPQANVVSILQWLDPAASPRILIGLG